MKSLKCYIAGPLFSSQDRQLLEELASFLEKNVVSVFLPHRDTGDLGIVKKNNKSNRLRDEIFNSDVENLNTSDFIIALLDGSDVDSGTACEIGVAYSLNIPIFGLKTDLQRRGGVINNMIWGACCRGQRVYVSKEELFKAIMQFLKYKRGDNE